MSSSILVTGGAGFIGSALVRRLLLSTESNIVVLDALTYAGNLENLDGVIDGHRCRFLRGSITDTHLVETILQGEKFDGIINCAAESHVDRSIESAVPFIHTNVVGTQVLLDVARRQNVRRFLQMSTDEVYGDLPRNADAFRSTSPLAPSSPYSASKAAADLLVLAAHRTHGQDVVITRCSNNYGPRQFPEKFIPLMILNALEGRPLPVYGDGRQIRDWIHVDDHCEAVIRAYHDGDSGAVYTIGGDCERENIDVVHMILMATASASAVTHVTDRPGHDRRYAIDVSETATRLGWTPSIRFEDGLAETIEWYRTHQAWWTNVKSGDYRTYYERHYGSFHEGTL